MLPNEKTIIFCFPLEVVCFFPFFVIQLPDLKMNNALNNEKEISLLKKNGATCFETVYNHYLPPLYAYATQYLEKEDAEEVVQDTMLWLWENRASLIEELSLKSLLFTIVRNKCLNRSDRYQRRNRIYRIIGERYREKFEDPDFYLGNELFSLFSEALENLPESYREAFEMSRVEGYTHKEIAEKLQVSPQTVNYRLSQALKILRDKLKDYLPVFLVLLS